MANMSYCRFENTSSDLRDCLEAMRDPDINEETGEPEPMNEYETRGRRQIIKMCVEILELVEPEELEELGIDPDAVASLKL